MRVEKRILNRRNPFADFRNHRCLSVRGSRNPYVLEPVLLARIYIGITRYACEPVEILVFKVRAVAPAEYFESYEILTCPDEPGDVETGLKLAVLAVTYLLAVYPDADIRTCGAYVEENILSLPLRSHIEGPAVLSGVIIPTGNERRIGLMMTLPCIADIDIYRISVTIEFPHARNRHGVPAGSIEVCPEEIGRTGIDGLIPAEVPDAVKNELISIRLKR